MNVGVRRICATAVFLLGSARALATTVERLTLAELATRAERIVDARVSAIGAARDGRGRPATRVTLEVRAALKGADAKALEFLLPGGTDGATTLMVPGIPTFQAGEEVVLFLTVESRAGLRVPVGLGQGTYRATVDAKTHKTLVAPDLSGIELLDPKTGAKSDAKSGATAAAPARVERAAFLDRVRELVAKK